MMNGLMKMKSYILTDLAVAIALAFAAMHLLRNSARSTLTVASSTDSCNATAIKNKDAAMATAVPRETRQQYDSPSALLPSRVNESPSLLPLDNANDHHSSSSSHFKIGSIVELYSSQSYFAIPAIILQDKASSGYYSLHNTITNASLANIESQFIHEYKIYDDGTRASCNIGSSSGDDGGGLLQSTVYMTPCAILSHSIRRKSGIVLYEVAYLNEEEELVNDTLPFSRVQRRRGNNGYGMRGGVR